MVRCKKCKNKGSIGGSAMTKFTCEVCGKQDWWCNTSNPPICSKCSEIAKKDGRCHYCNGSL